MRIFTLMFAAVAALFVASPASAQLRVLIDSGNYQPLPTAIPDFGGADARTKDLGAQIAEIVRADLGTSPVFKLLDQKTFIEKDLDINVYPTFRDWTVIGADALVVGSVRIDEQNNLVAEFRIFDTFRASQVFDQRYKVPGTDNIRRVAHKIADDIYSQFTGEKGYFDSRIVFISESGKAGPDRRFRLAIMDQDGKNPEHLLGGVTQAFGPRFSPTEQKIIYSAFVPDERNPRIMRTRVFLYDIANGRAETLVNTDNQPNFSARFSPDGRSVVMTQEKAGNSDIWLIDVATRARKQLTFDSSDELSPSFSPDGRQLVFVSNRSGSPQLYVMNADGSGQARRITFGQGQYSAPVWSPRGDLISYVLQKPGSRFAIGVISPSGESERMLTQDSYFADSPTWSPNGRVVAFQRITAPGAAPQLWSIDLSGRAERRLTTPGDASDPAWGPLLP